MNTLKRPRVRKHGRPAATIHRLGMAALSESAVSFGVPAAFPSAVAQSGVADSRTEASEATVRLNFEGADIREVIHSLATALGIHYHYTIDPRVQGQVTIQTASDIPRRDLLPLFHQILRSSGVAANRVGDIYHIIPVGEAKTRAVVSKDQAENRALRAENTFVIELVKVEHVSAEEMANILQPFISPGGDVLAYPRANLVVISDLASNVLRLRDMVDVFDTATFHDLHAQVYRIEHANIEGEELSSVVLEPYGVIATDDDAAVTHGVFVIPLTRLNSVVVIAFNTEIFTYKGAGEPSMCMPLKTPKRSI